MNFSCQLVLARCDPEAAKPQIFLASDKHIIKFHKNIGAGYYLNCVRLKYLVGGVGGLMIGHDSSKTNVTCKPIGDSTYFGQTPQMTQLIAII